MKTGWLCPRCESIHSPHTQSCDCMNQPETEENEEAESITLKQAAPWILGIVAVVFVLGVIIIVDGFSGGQPETVTVTKTKYIEKPPRQVDHYVGAEIDTTYLWGSEADDIKEALGLEWYDALPDKVMINTPVYKGKHGQDEYGTPSYTGMQSVGQGDTDYNCKDYGICDQW